MRDKSGEPLGSDQKTVEVEPASPTKQQQQQQPQSQKNNTTSDAERLQMIVFIDENFLVLIFE